MYGEKFSRCSIGAVRFPPYELRSWPFFDHEVGFKIDLPVQDDADMEQAVFLDLQVRREGVFVPAEKDAGGDGLDIHGRRLEDAAVLGGIFDHFLVEHRVLAPTRDGVKFFEMIGEGRHVEIAPDEVGGVTILLAGLEVFADHKLKKADRVGGHGADTN